MSELPSRFQTHVVRPLTNVLLGNMQDPGVYINQRVFPSIDVEFQSDLYYTMPPDAWYRTVAQERGPATESVGVVYDLDPNNRYDCRVKAVHYDLADQSRKNYSTPYDAETAATKLVSANIKLRQELDFQQTYLRKGVWQGFVGSGGVPKDFDCSDTTVSHGQWDLASSDPIMDIEYLMTFMMSQTGRKPNKLTVSKDVFSVLKNHPQFVDRIKYSQIGITTEQLMASIFGIDDLIVAEAVLNSAQEGQRRQMGFMASNCFLLTYSPNAPTLMEPAAGLMFNWTGYDPATKNNAAVAVIPLPWRRCSRIEAEIAYDMRITCPECGIFGINVLSKAGSTAPVQASQPAAAAAS